MHIPKHALIKISVQKIKKNNLKRTFKDKIYNNHIIYNFEKLKTYIYIYIYLFKNV
jgi:hypothetical protein